MDEHGPGPDREWATFTGRNRVLPDGVVGRMRSLGWVALAGVVSCGGAARTPSSIDAPAPIVEARPKVERIALRTGSTVALARIDGALVAYVADEDDRAVLAIDVDAARILGRYDLDGVPAQIVSLPGARLAVAVRDRARVAVLEGAGDKRSPLREIASAAVPTEPIGLALTPDDATLLVASGWGRALAVVSLADMRLETTKELGREPRAVATSRDGKRAFVVHAAGSGLSIVDLADRQKDPKVWNLEAHGFGVGFRNSETGPFKRRAAQGFAVAVAEEPAGRVLVPHVAVHTAFGERPSNLGMEPEPITGYGSPEAGPAEVLDVAVVDEATGTPLDFEPHFEMDGTTKRVRMVGQDNRCVLPRAAAVARENVYVACVDSDRVLELDAASLHPERAQLREWKVPRGPTGLAVDAAGQRLVVWSSLARAVSVLGTAENAKHLSLASVTVLARTPIAAEIARGRELFHSGEVRISGDGRACASCHPDGRDDGLVWATPDGPRQTPSLAGRIDGTAPYGWTGAAKDVESHVPKTFARLGGSGLKGSDKAALLAYVRAMSPPPAIEAKEDARLARGKAIFHSEEAGCASCHGIGGELPDGATHDVKSRALGDTKAAFDTPSLRFVGGTGPWFHDGRYKTLRDLLVKSDGKMGHTKHLSQEDLDALEAYLRAR